MKRRLLRTGGIYTDGKTFRRIMAMRLGDNVIYESWAAWGGHLTTSICTDIAFALWAQREIDLQ